MFEELNDDIIADDWLVPQDELTERRVIRQTAHYNIYKADWFGDVLVYEPRLSAGAGPKIGAETGRKFQTTTTTTATTAAANGSWLELNELRLVAHENFILFMGASVQEEPLTGHQNTSLVMEMLKPNSVSLFDLLHAGKSRPSSPLNRFFASNCRQQSQLLAIGDKLNICQQVTNAMTYLHDKDIVHGRLTSVNIFIESNQRVKISLIDNDQKPIASCDSSGPGARKQGQLAFNLPTLTYLSPELVKTISVERAPGATVSAASAAKCETLGNGKQHGGGGGGERLERLTQRGQQISGDGRVQIDSRLLTKQADVYSFGTLLFELFEERFPFALDDVNYNTTQTSQQQQARRSPSPTLVSTTKLFDTLCLAYHSPTYSRSPRSPRSPRFSPPLAHHQLQGQSTPLSTTVDKHWNGNIKSSASELIFQIGSGQISDRNKHRNKCPALVDHIISACWSAEAACRPNFKQMRLE